MQYALTDTEKYVLRLTENRGTWRGFELPDAARALAKAGLLRVSGSTKGLMWEYDNYVITPEGVRALLPAPSPSE